MSEAQLTTETIRRFRQAYAPNSARRRRGDDLYERSARAAARSASSTGCRCSTTSSTRLFDYVGDAPFVLDARAEEAAHERFAQIADYYAARKTRPTRGPGQGGL
jgi:transcription-repair coupling factor (superfamily II helicase)